ncbi:MAG: hypothetical protein ACKVPX_04120 [Myxococcaceae bacterium]
MRHPRKLFVLLMVATSLAACGVADPEEVVEAKDEANDPKRGSVDPGRELVIVHPSVVDDPARTTYVPGGTRSLGAWSFGRLIEKMARGKDPSAFVFGLFAHWSTDQQIGDSVAAARPAIQSFLVDPWRAASGCPSQGVCALDFSKAPLRLTAIVNRIDKRPLPDGYDRVTHSGEGRFVFNVLNSSGVPSNFTVILEYFLPAKKSDDILSWAQRWHRLGAFPFGEAYNSELQKITEDFSSPDAGHGASQRSTFRFLRTNEVSLAAAGSDPTNLPSTKLWEMRSYELGRTGWLAPTTVAQTPRLDLNGSAWLADFLNDNAASVLNGEYVVPASILDAASPTPKFLLWSAPGVTPPDVVRAFALGTCSGCHLSETGANFAHMGKRELGLPALQSDWMSTVEIPRRVNDFEELITFSKIELKNVFRNRFRAGPGRAH